MMKVKIKKLNENAVIPTKAHPTDAGFDLVATSRVFDKEGNVTYGTGLAFEIPEGYAGLLFPRSSISKKDLMLSNGVGVIDSHFRGEVMAKFKPALVVANRPECGGIGEVDGELTEEDYHGSDETEWDTQEVTFHGRDESYPDNFGGEVYPPRMYEVGDRIAQLVIMPVPGFEFEEAEELSATDRGTGGYGSTGR